MAHSVGKSSASAQGQRRHHGVAQYVRGSGVDAEGNREPYQIHEAQEYHDPFPPPVTARQYQCREGHGGHRHAKQRVDAHLIEGQRDGGELGDQGEEVEQQQIGQRKASPPLPEAPVNHGGVALARRDSQPHHHLLNKVGNRQ